MVDVCAECGSKVSYRSVNVSTAEDEAPVFQKVPNSCTNTKCINVNPRHHDFDWFRTVERQA